ncbi:Hypp247 [Branchiostoma lanceolatum]|uniref:Hypp247 protein n=1 Tax=Branchiostoma lanceolatum TaxID=7740 RepID=A0A8J9VBV5_BRALA|nr:Hypp247 [Branchiostoma lanceolatum]
MKGLAAHLLTVLPALAAAHSWITCTDYLEMNGDYWDHELCRAFPRSASRMVPRTALFGSQDTYSYFPSPGAVCRTSRNDATEYAADHPMATYYQGQTVVLTHPTKNHVADVQCTNKYIPDNGNWIAVGPVNGASDPALFDGPEWTQIADMGKAPVGYEIPDAVTSTYPKPGFQNAPKFCENMDKAMGTYNFTIPSNLTPGRYTFLWKWIFNAGNDPYTSCWEADVVATKAERNAIYTSMGLSTIDFWYAGGTTPVVPPVIPVVDGLGGTDNTGTGTIDNTGTGTIDNTGTGTIDNTGTGTIDNTGTGTIDNTGTGTIDNTGTGTGTTSGTTTPLSFAFNVNAWPGGGQGSLVLPSPRPSGDWYVELKFPCAGSGIILDTWHGDQIQTPEEEAQGIFKIKQTGWQLDKNDIGFVVNTMAGCFVDENQVTAQIVSN